MQKFESFDYTKICSIGGAIKEAEERLWNQLKESVR